MGEKCKYGKNALKKSPPPKKKHKNLFGFGLKKRVKGKAKCRTLYLFG